MSKTHLIHIGRCGGRSIRDGLKNATQNSNVKIIHFKKPPYRKDLKYIIIARNPISRIESAFRWRYNLVVAKETQKYRFKGEYEVLKKYGTLNNLAESLYSKNLVNKVAQQDMNKIVHIRENISFYLYELLNKCSPNQIIAVLMQENLNNDIMCIFGYKNKLNKHNSMGGKLSKEALKNLMIFLRKDYEMLITLYCWGKIKQETFMKCI